MAANPPFSSAPQMPPEAPHVPSHVPADLIYSFPFAFGATVTGDPFGEMASEVHNNPPIFFAPNVGPGATPAWIVRKAKDLRDVYLDTTNFSSVDFAPFAKIIGGSWSLIPAEIDPPMHARYRSFVNPAFTPKAMSKLEEGIRRYARQDIITFRDKGRCDFMTDFAYEFPIKVFLELMGLPLDMVGQFLAWENDLLHNSDMSRLAGSAQALVTYLEGEIDDRRKSPREDLISFGLNGEIDDRSLTQDELIGFTFLLFIGGLDTVSANIGLHAMHLAQNVDHQRLLRVNPAMIPQAIDELMRAYAAVTTFRTCVNEVEFKGVKMMPGDKIAMCTTVAGRDPEEYVNPGEVRFDRKARAVSFGYGSHLCVGMHLARREMRIGMEEYLSLLPDFAIESGRALEFHTGVIQPTTLPLVW